VRRATFWVSCLFGLCLVVFSPACAPYYWVGIKLLYDQVPLSEAQIARNISYDPSAPDDSKRQLDLFLPSARGWPVVVFVHGGGWMNGDRSLKVGGADVYGNIGRMLASRGFGTAVVSYRLLHRVDWRTQAGDVARAVAWVQNNTEARGARPKSVFLMGHSAGAQLAMRIAADPRWLQEAGGDSFAICGVIAVSGAGYDMEDAETRRLDTDKFYYQQRFSNGDKDATWRGDASPIRSLDSDDPPMLLLYAHEDHRALIRQSRVVDERLRKLGIGAGLIVIPGTNHQRIVLKLSQPQGPAGEAILKFLNATPCPRNVS